MTADSLEAQRPVTRWSYASSVAGSRMKRHVTAPDGRAWDVQLVWWPRPGALQATGDADYAGGAGVPQLFGVLIDAIHIVLWPLVCGLRVVFRRPWLIEAFQSDNHAKGAAWRVHGLGVAESAVEAIATGIEAGNHDPAPPGASPTHFRVRWGPLGTPR
jgi:hypothetical protein